MIDQLERAVAPIGSPEFAADPYPTYAHLQARGPVHRDEAAPIWHVVGYHEVRACLGDSRLAADRCGWFLSEEQRGTHPDLARILPPILFGAGLVLVAIGLVVSGRRRGLARNAAIVLVVIAVIPLLIRYLAPKVASRAVGGEDRDLVEQVAVGAMDGWWIAMVAAFILAAAAVVIWLTSRTTPARRRSLPLWYE